MARQQIVSYTLTCDVCSEEIADSDADDASQKVSWEGAEYAVDLCATHQNELTDALSDLAVFVDAGRRTPAGRPGRAVAQKSSSRPARGRRAAAPSATGRRGASALAAVRTWAIENGHKVGDRGRIPATIMAAYQDANESDAAPSTPKRRARKAAAPS